MGTSKSFVTPEGGKWTPLKRNIGKFFSGTPDIPQGPVLGTAIGAIGGLLPGYPPGPGGTPSQQAATRVGNAIGGLAAFGQALVDGGLDNALGLLGMGDLSGRSASEVIGHIAEHIGGGNDGLAEPILISSLRDTFIEIAQLGGELGYQDLESSLQQFLTTAGIEGLIEVFLGYLVFDCVWVHIEQYLGDRQHPNSEVEAFSIALENESRSQVRALIDHMKTAGRFEAIDWFGHGGQTLARDTATALQQQLLSLA